MEEKILTSIYLGFQSSFVGKRSHASIAPQKHTSFALSPRKARTHAKEREREREKEREAFCVENIKEEEAFGEL